MVTLFLGTHQPCWLARLAVPLFVSHRRLHARRHLPRACADWALDSGGFSELSLFGGWRTKPRNYARAARRYMEEIGRLRWAAIQDWMCEPWMLRRTGLSLREHQRRTVDSFERLRELAPEVPWAPVLQGWQLPDYLRHLEFYCRRGHELREERVVGLGSMCRRQGTAEAERIVRELAALGLRLHGFGFKIQGLARASDALVSSDSLAWSFDARRSAPLEGCEGKHKNCANCERFALAWWHRVRAKVGLATR